MPKEYTQVELLAWLKDHAKVSGPDNTAIVDPETGIVHKFALTVAEVTIGNHTYGSSLSSGHNTHQQPGYEEYGETLRRITLYGLLDRTRARIVQELHRAAASA